MTLAQTAQLADLLGVIASLLFVALQLRRNGRDTRQANWRELPDDYREFKAVTNDLDCAAFVMRARSDYDALDPAEKLAFEHYQEQGIHVMSNFYKHAAAVPGELKGLEGAVDTCLYEHLEGAGARAWYAANKRRGRLTPGTHARLDAILAREDGRRRSPR